MADFNRRFAVIPALEGDAHVPYLGKAQALERILSVQAPRCLSKNLSCQFERQLLQVKTQSQGLSLRGARIRVHCHHDGRMELVWQGRTLAFETSTKPIKQSATANAKEVNARVDWALEQRRDHAPRQHIRGRKTRHVYPTKHLR